MHNIGSLAMVFTPGILIFFLLPLPVYAQINGTVPLGASLSATEQNSSSSWLSPSGDFAFGFRQLDNNTDFFLLSIWYAKIPDKTVVWHAGVQLVTRGAKLKLTADRGLLLTDSQGQELWNTEPILGVVSGVMSDVGNFALQGRNSNEYLWQTFKNPSNTMLPTQLLDRGGVLYSLQSETNYSKGRFQLSLRQDGNLELYTVNLPTDNPNSYYYQSDTAASDSSLVVSPGSQFVFNQSGAIYVLRENGDRKVLNEELQGEGDNYLRLTLDFDGILTLYSHPKAGNSSSNWTIRWYVPKDICQDLLVAAGLGICGYNSICTLKEDSRPTCSCPSGYSLLDPNDVYGNCKPDFTLDCDHDLSSSPNLYGVEVLINTDWPLSDYTMLKPFTAEKCNESCLQDCMCAVAIFREETCWKKKLPLSNGRVDPSLDSKAFLKIGKDNPEKTKNEGNLIAVGSVLFGDNDARWLSPSEDFAFGFYQLENGNFLLAIWYNKLTSNTSTVVWYANGENPAPRRSKLELFADRGLVLTDPQGTQLWSSGEIPAISSIFNAVMNDTGNFQVLDKNSNPIWQSFDHPTDTLLPGQTMEIGSHLYSRKGKNNFSRGRFVFRMLDDGNAVLNTINLPSNHSYDAYYASGTNDERNGSNGGLQLVYNTSGYLYVLKRNQETKIITSKGSGLTSGNYQKVTLNFDGVLTLSSHSKEPSSANESWDTIASMPDNICLNISGDLGIGPCGYNSICSIQSEGRPNCKCPNGYSLFDPTDALSGCKPDFMLDCGSGGQSAPLQEYSMEKISNTDWPTSSDYELIAPYNQQSCENSCLHDCLCAAAIFKDNNCWKKKLPLSNGRDGLSGVMAFLKLRVNYSSLPPQRHLPKDQDTLVIAVSSLLGTSAFVNFILVTAICSVFFFKYKNWKLTLRISSSETCVRSNLRQFTYEELTEATNGFKEELGRGSCGIVYKGETESSVLVAVKKLDKVFQDSEKEFKAEVNIIGQTHHKNLVQLIGYCEEKRHRLVVYEFMSNGTLARFLFGDSKPSWTQRIKIAFGIARGLVYLHEECSTQIIHCDIKPQNILLDEHYNARISDFGLAKLMLLNQSHSKTNIRGTKGYVAPDWFRSAKVSTKVDVYSFGVVLLEIICCRRNVGIEIDGGVKGILTDWAYDCYVDGNLDALIENDIEAINDIKRVESFVKVGIWCLQEDPNVRPTMKKVMLMLEGIIQVSAPPTPFSFTSIN